MHYALFSRIIAFLGLVLDDLIANGYLLIKINLNKLFVSKMQRREMLKFVKTKS